jgi:hypothetical protein
MYNSFTNFIYYTEHILASQTQMLTDKLEFNANCFANSLLTRKHSEHLMVLYWQKWSDAAYNYHVLIDYLLHVT